MYTTSQPLVAMFFFARNGKPGSAPLTIGDT
jgi:hypothetical protein